MFILTLILPTSALTIYDVNQSSFDITDYTLEEFLKLDIKEKKIVFDKFVDKYNPYGIKDIQLKLEKENSTIEINPQWSSGNNYKHTEQELSTHQLITLEAFSRFIDNHGFYKIDGTQALAITLYLAAASGMPDMDERDGGIFRNHFYDPDSGNNYRGDSSFTAKTEAEKHINNAYLKLRTNYFMDVESDDFIYIIEELGRALHYIQDVCEPHHAANKIAINSNHSAFESYVEGKTEDILSVSNNTNCYYHDIAKSGTTGDLMYKAAKISKPKYDNIKWDHINLSVASSSVWESVYFSEALIFKLFKDSRDYYNSLV